MVSVIDKIIAAHGGADYWNSLNALEAEISARGFLFTAKRLPVMDHVKVRALTREPRFTFFDHPRQGDVGELDGNERVFMSDPRGKIVSERSNPRSSFREFGRFFHWDSLDFVYFGGYATWNYLMTPFLFKRDGFRFEELAPMTGAFGTWSRLRVTFPDDIPSHCKTQIFYFDEQFLLRRLDYTAEVVGQWAHAAHLCDDYSVFGGLRIPTRRRVYPILFGSKPLPGPTLVAIDVHDVRPIPA